MQRKCFPFLLWFVLALIAFATYSSIANDLFVSDDYTLVRAVRDSGPFSVWSGPHGLAPWFFRPLVTLSFFLDYKIWGTRAFGYHFTNIIFHTTNAWLVQRIAKSVLENAGSSVAAALIFIVLPVHAESVSWISGRTDVIATTFGLGAFLSYFYYTATGRPVHFVLSLALLVAGLSAKESILALPLVMSCYSLLVLVENRRRGFLLNSASFAIILPYLYIRRMAVGGWIGGYGLTAHLNHDPEFIKRNVLSYIQHALGFGEVRHGLGFWPFVATLSTVALAAALFLTLGIGVFDRLKRQAESDRIPAFLVSSFFISILPSINLVVGADATEGERFIYLASAWLAILMAALLRPAITRIPRIAVLTVLVASCLGALEVRNNDWHEASRLCRNVIDDLRAAQHVDDIYILDIPDDLHGAYVFRNSLWDALALLAPNFDMPVYLVAYRRLLANTHPTETERHGGSISLVLPEGGDRFEYWNLLSPATNTYNLTQHDPLRLSVSFHTLGTASYYTFSEGHLHLLVDQRTR